MRTWLLVALLLALAVRGSADAPSDLAGRLKALRSPEPLAARLGLQLRLERTLHHKTVKGEASLRLDVDEDEGGLRMRWDAAVLREADAEEQERDQSPDRLTPVREALKELDPGRVAHLLDQVGTLAGLTKGVPIEESVESHEGREARRLVYAFQPRLSSLEAYYLHHSKGRFTVWIAADGTPLSSESVATFEGKTSRMFGRFGGTTTVRTQYAAQGGRLTVAERETNDLRSHEDGGEAEHTWQRFVVTRR
jgi:hypothetical protein